MVLKPTCIQTEPGDTMTFVPTDKSHNAETIAGMLLKGTEPFAGKMSAEISVTFKKEAVHDGKCKPYFAICITAAVQVGEAASRSGAASLQYPFGAASPRRPANLRG